MSIEIRLPNITGQSDKEQLLQMRSYLYQLAEQLQWALNVTSTTTPREATPQAVSIPRITHLGANETQVTFAALKPLIIKSADIVEAYYEEINKKLVGIYVAESDFGTFKQWTEQSIEANSESITNHYSNTQAIEKDLSDAKISFDTRLLETEEGINEDITGLAEDINELDHSIAEVNAHVRSGLLYYDDEGIPVYGLEIGQRTLVDDTEVFNKYARFTSDRLSFYDQNDNEVAYVSDYNLFIRNVEITSSHKIGGFKDIVMANGDVVTKWVGGDE